MVKGIIERIMLSSTEKWKMNFNEYVNKLLLTTPTMYSITVWLLFLLKININQPPLYCGKWDSYNNCIIS